MLSTQPTQRRLQRWLLLLVGVFSAVLVSAQPNDPIKEMEKVTTELMSQLPKYQNSREKTLEFLNASVAPWFDFADMTRFIAGPSYRSAAPEERSALEREFRTLLLRTYASAVQTAKVSRVQYERVARRNERAEQATIRAVIHRVGKEPLPLDYVLHLKDEQWRIRDVAFNGLSLLASYRESFTRTIQSGGIQKLTQELAEKNAALK